MSVWRNSKTGYGRISMLFHWLSALTVFSLFGVGLYMMTLTYYDALYQVLPGWHMSVGLTLFAVTLLRLLWKTVNPKLASLPGHNALTVRLASIAHYLLYGLILAVMVSGYLITTADGRPISFFGLFNVPALVSGIDGQEDLAGEIHFYLAWTIVIFAGLHGLAALKHHFIDKDQTLIRMISTK